MTDREHLLMFALLVGQMNRMKIITDILRSHGFATADEENAFAFATSVDALSKSALFEQAKDVYLQLAGILGIHTGLENLPPSQLWVK